MLAFVRSLGGGLVYFHPLDPVDPSFGSGVGGPGIDNDLPWAPGHPGNRPPGSWGGYPSNGLPGSPGHPDNRPPATRPPVVAPGMTLVMVRDPEGVWHYATVDASTPPPKPVPVPPPDHISNRPPGSGNYPTGGPVPPTVTPTA